MPAMIFNGLSVKALKDIIKNKTGYLNLGSVDAFSRTQIWNSGTNASIRLGSLAQDGDPLDVSSEGSVFYGANAAADPMAGGNFSYARIKPLRFGIYNASVAAGFAGYIFRVDNSQMYFAKDDGTQTFVVNRVTGEIGYTPATPANWSVVPTGVKQALDLLAATLNTNPPVAFSETPVNPVDGFNAVFTLTKQPNGTLLVARDGQYTTEFTLAYPNVTMNTPPALGQKIEFYYVTGGFSTTSYISFSEIPAGIVDGFNDSFVITRVPNGSIMVEVDGQYTSDFTFVHPTITMTTPPYVGQKVEAFYLTNGVSGTTQANAGNQVVEYRTITPIEAAAKQLTLTATPVVAARTMLDGIGGTAQIYGTDFIVVVNVLDWNGLGLDGQLLAGETIRLMYYN